MDANSSKRRKLSPPAQPGPSNTTTAAHPPRPSFASPTKASMERFNSEILRSRESSPRRPQNSGIPGAQGIARSGNLPTQRKLFPTGARPENDNGTPTRVSGKAQENQALGTEGGAMSPEPAPQDVMDAVLAADVPASEVPSEMLAPGDEGPQSTPTKRAAYSAASKPQPRPLPPPGPEEDVLEPLARARQQRLYKGVIPETTAPEPELPPTPEHAGPVMSTPPSGTYQSPSRRPKRPRAAMEKSSPLKKQMAHAAAHQGSQAPVVVQLQSTAALRGLSSTPSIQSDAAKKLARLQAKNKELQQQLKMLTKQLQQPQSDETLDVLLKCVPGASEPEAESSFGWNVDAGDVSRLLPFSKSRASIPAVFRPQLKEDEKPLLSHEPLPFTEENKDFMTLFSPLILNTQTEAITPAAGDKTTPLYQKHHIQAQSTIFPGLVAFSLVATVDTHSQKTDAIEVVYVHPAAVAETRSFFDSIANPQASTSRASRHNITVMGTAMGEWLRVAAARAGVWSVLHQELTTKGGLEKLSQRMQRRKGRGRPNTDDDEDQEGDEWPVAANAEPEWPQDEAIDVGTPEDAAEDAQPGPTTSEKKRLKSQGRLLPYLGRTFMDFTIPRLDRDDEENGQASLRVQWKIGFKATGYAVSNISVLIGVPIKWRAADDRGKLGDIPAMFEKLLAAGEEPIDAVRIVATLLAGRSL